MIYVDELRDEENRIVEALLKAFLEVISSIPGGFPVNPELLPGEASDIDRLSVRAARRAIKPGALLLGSAALRIALLLFAGWSVAQLGTSSSIGFASGFLFVRYAAIAFARLAPVREGT